MDPIVNIEGAPGRIVGKRKPQKDCLKAGMEMQAVLRQLRATLKLPGVPKGVYRFKTHEEADQWLTKMLARPQKS